MQERKRRAPAQGYAHRTPAVKRLSTSFDDVTFDQVRQLALEQGTSCSEQVRQLVEFGLETLAEQRGAGGRV